MNAAARAINQSNLFCGHLSTINLSKTVRCLVLMLLTLLISSIVVIYTINEYRSSFSQLQQLQAVTQQLQLQHGQLLLEQASLATPARVEALALKKLRMHLPQEKDILTLQPHDH